MIVDATALPVRALGYVERILAFCDGLNMASERGQRRDDIRPGLRIVPFEERVTIACVVEENAVIILRIFYAGANWESEL